MDRLKFPLFDKTQASSSDRFSLLDLIPLTDLQKLQDLLAEINDITSIIVDPDGNPLTMPSNRMPICDLANKTQQGALACMQNDMYLNQKVRETLKPESRLCENFGFMNAAVPIIVNDQHLANWWIKQPCRQDMTVEQITAQAARVGIEADQLLSLLGNLPTCGRSRFEKILAWIDGLTQKFAHLGFHNRELTHGLSKLHHIENELNRYKKQMELLVKERTADLIQANSRLQLEALERDLVEEQIERKSRLLDAINKILQQTLNDRSDHALAHMFLTTSQELTKSGFGFVVESTENHWELLAANNRGAPLGHSTRTIKAYDFFPEGIWRSVIEKGEPIIISDRCDMPNWRGLPKPPDDCRNLMVVPLRNNRRIAGFIALTNASEGFSSIDRDDIQALVRAFMEVLLRKRLETAKDNNEKCLSLALDSANEGFWDYFPRTGRIYYSPSWFFMLGYQADEFPISLETWSTLTHPDDLPLLENALAEVIRKTNSGFEIELRMLSKTNQWRWIKARGRTVESDDNGKVLRIVGILSDISKYKQVELALQKANEELQRLAALDGLTQIANRMRFEDRLTQEWRRARREKRSLAMILCDIDFFKNFNDRYGHIRGDQALCTVAQCINTTLKRPMDLLARYGGEEFAMILPNTDINGAMQVAIEVKSAIDALRLEHRGSLIGDHLTVSFGVAALIPAGGMPLKTLVDTADQAMYRAKNQGRNCIVAADDPPRSDSESMEEQVEFKPAKT
jgi:diguanylate cyclase (GGDEF)-like protein/PAS domain S-box-containing protein